MFHIQASLQPSSNIESNQAKNNVAPQAQFYKNLVNNPE